MPWVQTDNHLSQLHLKIEIDRDWKIVFSLTHFVIFIICASTICISQKSHHSGSPVNFAVTTSVLELWGNNVQDASWPRCKPLYRYPDIHPSVSQIKIFTFTYGINIAKGLLSFIIYAWQSLCCISLNLIEYCQITKWFTHAGQLIKLALTTRCLLRRTELDCRVQENKSTS